MARIWVVAAVAILVAMAGCSGKAKPSATTFAAPTSSLAGGGPVESTTQQATVTQSPATVIITASPVTHTVTVTPSPATSSSGSANGGGDNSTLPPTAYAGSPPVLTQVAGSALGTTTARISWKVEDDYGNVASLANWGRSPSMQFTTPVQHGNGSYQMDLTGLSSCTNYSFQVVATDVAGQSTRSAVLGFATPTGPNATATPVTATSVMHNSMNVTWTVDGPADMTSVLQYGPTTSYGFTSGAGTGSGTQATQLSGLTQNTDYHVRVHLVTPCKTVDSADVVIHTATLVAVDILPGSGQFSFAPAGSRTGGIITAPKDTLLVFQVHNTDTAAAHDFSIQGQSFSSGPIPSGATTTISPAITLAQSSAPGYLVYSAQDGNDAFGNPKVSSHLQVS